MDASQISPAPFTSEDISSIKGYLFKLIATHDQGFTKLDNSTVIDSIPGAIIASPSMPGSTFSQDYFFHWVRDGSIVMDEVVYLYKHATDPAEKAQLKVHITNFLNWVKVVQVQPPLNGINVLGEPKFNINGTLWTGTWSRPQNDGAALRAIALIHLANVLLEEGQNDALVEILYNHTTPSLIKTDLEYVASRWHEKTIGPWEEVYGYHFYAEAVQRKALMLGADLAKRMDDPGASDYYLDQVRHLELLMNTHWSDGEGYFHETLRQQEFKGGGVAVSVILGFVYGRTHNPHDFIAASSSKALGSGFYVRDTFEHLYQINMKDRAANNSGPLIGRYQSDTYDGNQSIYGNPWFLTTNIFAEYYYAVAEDLLLTQTINVTFLSKIFFEQAIPNLSLDENTMPVINQQKNPELFDKIVLGLITSGDNMLRAVKQHSIAYEDGSSLHLSEQLDRRTGTQASAQDLAWSYCSLLTALQRREKAVSLAG